MLRHRIPNPGKQLLFVVLNFADLVLTAWLLSTSEGGVYEANPVARWWLVRHGWLGLAAFKAAKGTVDVPPGRANQLPRQRQLGPPTRLRQPLCVFVRNPTQFHAVNVFNS